MTLWRVRFEYLKKSQTFWTDATLNNGQYTFEDWSPVMNGNVPLDPQSGRPVVTLSRKGFVFQRKEDTRRFFAACRRGRTNNCEVIF